MRHPVVACTRQERARLRAAWESSGRLFEQTLNEAAALTRELAPAFDLVHDTLTADERARIRNGLLAPMVETIDKHKAGKSNWQSWHNAALVWGGGALVWGGGALPRFGDDRGSRPSDARPLLEAAYAATHEDEILALLPLSPSRESVQYGRDVARRPPPGRRRRPGRPR